MKLKERYLLLLLVILVGSAVLFYQGGKVISSAKSKIRTLDKKIEVKQQELNSAEVLNDELSGVRDVILNTITREQKVPADEINDFKSQLAAYADSLRIPVNGSDQKEVYSPGSIIEHSFTMQLECTYLQMGRYIAALEKTNRIMRIDTIDVSPLRQEISKVIDPATGQPPTETRYKVTIELTLFKVKKREV